MLIKILKTNNYGAGWSSWAIRNDVAEFMLTYEPIIKYIETKEAEDDGFGKHDLDENHSLVLQMIAEIIQKFGKGSDPYVGGAKNLEVVEVNLPSIIETLGLRAYDGKESLHRN